MIARRSALPPAMTHSRARSASSPRSTRSLSSERTTRGLSVDSSRRPQNVLVSLAIEAQQLDLPEWAVMWCAGKAERRGSKAACAALDGVKKSGLRADCARQGPQRGRPMPAMHRQPF